MSIWSKKTEEEKMEFIMRQALSACQATLLGTPNDNDEVCQIREFLKEVIDWIAPQVGLAGIPLYYPIPEEIVKNILRSIK